MTLSTRTYGDKYTYLLGEDIFADYLITFFFNHNPLFITFLYLSSKEKKIFIMTGLEFEKFI